jgi:hypothetical protein
MLPLLVGLIISALAGVCTCAVLCFGNPHKKNLLGKAAHFLLNTVPGGISAFLRVTRLIHVVTAVQAFGFWFMFKRHPVVQIAYVLLVGGCYIMFVIHGYPLMPNMFMAAYHKYVGAAVFGVCVVTFILASFCDPGVITSTNVDEYKRIYPFDNFLYDPRQCPQKTKCDPNDPKCEQCRRSWCTTCKFDKVARSKHSRVTDRCVARFDHYCIWLANDVGARNYRWFLSFLIFNSILLIYGSSAALSIFADDLVKHKLLEQTFINKMTGEHFKATYYILFQYFMFNYMELCMIFCLSTVMGVILTGFTVYHLFLSACNTTTNETYKWSEAERYHDAYARAQKAKAVKENATAPTISAVPANKYDLGTLNNFKELFFPAFVRSTKVKCS